MNVAEKEYHDSIDTERLYWKRLYYEKTEGKAAAKQMVDIDKEVRSRYPLELLEG